MKASSNIKLCSRNNTDWSVVGGIIGIILFEYYTIYISIYFEYNSIC